MDRLTLFMSMATKIGRSSWRAWLRIAALTFALFHSQEEEYQVALPFLKDGLKAGDRAVQIINKHERTERGAAPRKAGVERGSRQSFCVQLEIRTWRTRTSGLVASISSQ